MPEVEILTGKRNLETRSLWEEVFCEDSAEFVDYYYANKAENNVGFAIRQEGQIQSMLFLTPYQICVMPDIPANLNQEGYQHRVYQTYYIVGVATRESYRHRGFMTCLLEAAFEYMRKQNVLSAFLMPANPAIYEPFGFRYIYERKEYHFRDTFLPKCSTVRVRIAQEDDCGMLADFAMRELSHRYRFFLKRDETYYRLLIKELKSERGAVHLVYVQEMFAGYYLYAHEETAFVQEVLIAEKWEPLLIGKDGLMEVEDRTKPIIMGKYLGNEHQKDEILRALSDGEIADGLINEIV